MAHILCIEPDRTLARLYRDYLEMQGHTVRAAGNAEDAIIAADAQRPDLVVLELRLPRHSGIAFLQEFASYEDWRRVPIIVHTFLSPSHLDEYAEALADYGVLARLYKPQTTLQYLHTVIARYLVGPDAE